MKTGYRLEFRNGRPLIVGSTGETISPANASDCIIDIPALKHSTPELWRERARMFAGSGVHGYSLQLARCPGFRFTTRYWTGDGVYGTPASDSDGHCLNWQAATILELDPHARFFVRFGDQAPEAWFEANPDHCQRNSTGEERMWGAPQMSMASDKGLADLRRFMRHVIGYCEAQSWAERVYAYIYLPRGEGITNLVVSGMAFDVSPVMQAAFRQWVRDRYADEAALRAAWSDPQAAFDSVRVPVETEWRAAREQVEHWLEGTQLRRFRDYFELQRSLHLRWYRALIGEAREALRARPAVFGIDMAKQHLLGWQHNLFFNGAGEGPGFAEMCNASGSIDVGELLDEPGLDMLLTPADYTARSVGYGWEPEGIADSMLIRGKAIFIENDSRTFSTTGGEHTTAGAFRTVEEVRAGFLRNCAWILTRGGYDEWGTGGGSYYDRPLVQEHAIRPCVRLMDAARSWPHVETGHAVAMIVDDRSPWVEDGSAGFQNLACIWQRAIGLAHCGIPYRIYLFSDLEKAGMPDYRAYVFPNLFELNDERFALLESKVFRDGRMAVFGPGTGISDGHSLGAEWASRVLGVDMELIRKRAARRVIVRGSHPIARALPAALVYGDSLAYGPILVPAEGALEPAGAEELGLATMGWSVNRPGLFVKDHGTHKVAWSAAVPMPPQLLRELARSGGCHVWCEEDAVVLASDTIAALHSVKAGRHVLRLPGPRIVRDLLSGERSDEPADAIEMDIAPPETRVFYVG